MITVRKLNGLLKLRDGFIGSALLLVNQAEHLAQLRKARIHLELFADDVYGAVILAHEIKVLGEANITRQERQEIREFSVFDFSLRHSVQRQEVRGIPL